MPLVSTDGSNVMRMTPALPQIVRLIVWHGPSFTIRGMRACCEALRDIARYVIMQRMVKRLNFSRETDRPQIPHYPHSPQKPADARLTLRGGYAWPRKITRQRPRYSMPTRSKPKETPTTRRLAV